MGWSGGAGSTSSAGASYNLDTVGQGPIALAVGAGGGCLDICTFVYPFSPLSPSLWETARYRLKYCLKGPLNLKQPTNKPSTGSLEEIVSRFFHFLLWPPSISAERNGLSNFVRGSPKEPSCVIISKSVKRFRREVV